MYSLTFNLDAFFPHSSVKMQLVLSIICEESLSNSNFLKSVDNFSRVNHDCVCVFAFKTIY